MGYRNADDNRSGDERRRTTREEGSGECNASVWKHNFNGLRYHLLKMILQYLITYRSTHLRSTTQHFHLIVSTGNSRPAAHTARRPSHMNSFSLFLELRDSFEKALVLNKHSSACFGIGQKLNSMVEK